MSEGVVGRVKGKRLEIEWEIPNFLSLQSKWYVSPEYFFGDTSWHIKVYRNVCEEWIGLFVLRGDSGPPVTATCSMFLKTTGGRKAVWTDVESTLSGEREFWGRYCALEWSELIDRKSEFLPSGVLTVVATMNLNAERQTEDDGMARNTLKNCTKTSEAFAEIEAETGTGKLSRDLIEVLLSGENSDLTIKVKGAEFRLHRMIMGARTPVFSAMLHHDMTEKATGIVSINDCEPEVFRAFVRYVYSGRMDELTKDTVFGLFALADKYQVEELKTACFEFARRTLSADSFCDVVKLALAYDKRELLEQATDYLAERMVDVLQTVDWMNFMREHYIQANELLLKAARKNKTE